MKIDWKIVGITTLLFAIGTVVPGCLGQIIDADPPAGAEARGLPTKLKLSESIRVRNAYVRQENAFIASWDESISDAEEEAAKWAGVFATLTSPEALTSYGLNPASGGLAALLFLGGVFVTPKSKKQAEIDKAYDEGLAKGKELAKVENA